MIAQKNTIIIGAGLVGSLLAVYLRKQGHQVRMYERRPDMRKEKMSAGKSINLALSDRGIKALEEVGMMDEIRKIAIPMHGRFIHNADGSESYQPYGKEGQFINSVSRGELNKRLMDGAETVGAEIFFSQKCKQVDFENKTVHFENENGELQIVNYDLLFGADGAYSAARLSHQLQHDRFQYQQYYIDYGYKELIIPSLPPSPSVGGGEENPIFQLEKNALHIWPRGNYMLIALPNPEGNFTCTLFFPFEGEPSFASLTTKEKVDAFFKNTFADAYKMMPTLLDDFFTNPTSSLVTVKCFPWVRNDDFALIGDAAHAIVPFFGQGMNCGFEDCQVLNSLIEKHNDWQTILSEYQILRKPDGDAIADLAIENFVEMRDKVGDKKFLLQKKIESKFAAANPGLWIPAYSMVTFSPEIRYSDALKRGKAQQAIMDKVMATPDIENIWDSNEVMQMIIQQLKSNAI